MKQADGSYVITLAEEPGFLDYGSADISVEAMDACGVWSKPATYVICDNDIMPGSVEFRASGVGPYQGDDKITFSWGTPSHTAGHRYQIEYYNTFLP